MANVSGTNSEPLLMILKANGIDPGMMVDDNGMARTALQVLESHIGQALDIIEETESGQKD